MYESNFVRIKNGSRAGRTFVAQILMPDMKDCMAILGMQASNKMQNINKKIYIISKKLYFLILFFVIIY